MLSVIGHFLFFFFKTETCTRITSLHYEVFPRFPCARLLHLGPGLANALANLHNARRAGTPLVNIVGDMATWHHGADALLEMNIEGLAATVSSWQVAGPVYLGVHTTVKP